MNRQRANREKTQYIRIVKKDDEINSHIGSAVREMIIRNEIGERDPYAILHVPGKNGYSFGHPLWSLSGFQAIDDNRENDATALFNDIVVNAADRDGNMVLRKNEIDHIMREIIKNNCNITHYERKINAALSSSYGRRKIDTAFYTYVGYKISRVRSLIADLSQAGRTKTAGHIASNMFLQALVIDFDNQCDVGRTDSDDGIIGDRRLMEFIKDGVTVLRKRPIYLEGDFDTVNYVRFLFNTEFAYRNENDHNGVKDLIRRFFNTISVVLKYGFEGLNLNEWTRINNIMVKKIVGPF